MSLSPISSSSLPPVATNFSPLVAGEGNLAPPSNVTVAAAAPPAPPAKAAVVATAAAAQAVPRQTLDKAVEEINRFLKQSNTSLEFSIDKDSGRTLVQVIDTDTKDVIRQFPSKEALSLSHELDKLQGMLLREKA